MVPRSLLLSAKVTLLAAIYVTVAHWGLQFDPVNRFATIIWQPAGVSLAALLLFGRDLWPGIAIGAAIVNVWIGAPLPVACGIALGNTLEALLGWYALQKIPGFRLTVDRLRDALGFIVLAAILSTAVSATIGVTSLYLGGLIPGSRFAETWFTWWQGDALGDLIVAAFLLNWIPALWVPDRMSPRSPFLFGRRCGSGPAARQARPSSCRLPRCGAPCWGTDHSFAPSCTRVSRCSRHS